MLKGHIPHIRLLYLFAVIFFPSLLIIVILCLENIQPTNAISSIAIISLEPQICWGVLGQNFTVDINIYNVVDLYGWEFRLNWNATILDVVQVLEGPFLKNIGSTYFTSKVNNSFGYIIVDCTLLGNVPGVNGNGTLAAIKFYVETIGECPLDLYGATLVNSSEQPIEHTTVDGYYYTSIHDVAIIDLSASQTQVNVTAENQGTHMETFNVSVYYTRLFDPLVGTQTITLNKGDAATLTFTWAPPSPGRYEIRAEASVLLEESDTSDNVYIIIIQIGYSMSSLKEQNVNLQCDHYLAFSMLIVGLIIMVPKAFNKNEKNQITLLCAFEDKPSQVENVWQNLISSCPKNLR